MRAQDLQAKHREKVRLVIEGYAHHDRHQLSGQPYGLTATDSPRDLGYFIPGEIISEEVLSDARPLVGDYVAGDNYSTLPRGAVVADTESDGIPFIKSDVGFVGPSGVTLTAGALAARRRIVYLPTGAAA